MTNIPKATAIELTQNERTVLEGFVRSTKTQGNRMNTKAGDKELKG
jgi:hypothetical protein